MATKDEVVTALKLLRGMRSIGIDAAALSTRIGEIAAAWPGLSVIQKVESLDPWRTVVAIRSLIIQIVDGYDSLTAEQKTAIIAVLNDLGWATADLNNLKTNLTALKSAINALAILEANLDALKGNLDDLKIDIDALDLSVGDPLI